MTKRTHQSRDVIDEAISEIASDNTSGAAELLSRAARVFALLRARHSDFGIVNIEQAQQAVIASSIGIALAQPDMSPLLRLASAALSASRAATGITESLQSAETAALNFIERAQRASRDSASHAVSLISYGATVLTHSRSSTVLAAFVEAKHAGGNFSVVATESRPMLEGRTLAEELNREGIPVSLITDAAASLALDHVDLVLVGADKLTPANLVNKIGTRLIALAARERGLPVYALCDTSKFICEDYFGSANRVPRAAEEVWPDAPKGITVVNHYFEPTPLTCFTGIITEDGTLTIEDVVRRADQASIDAALVEGLALACDQLKGPPGSYVPA